ncbi:MAG TPA: ferritin-like domain-containing protein [Lacunisphaera sp.]
MHAPKNLYDVFVDELKDLHNAEQQLIRALPRMAAAATHDELRACFREHLEQTEVHVLRLDHIARLLDLHLSGKRCPAMEGLITEGEEKLAASGDDSAKDASLIGAAQKIEHYEMAGYGTVRSYARLLGYPEIAAILQRTLDEEGATDKRLTYLAESINVEANV